MLDAIGATSPQPTGQVADFEATSREETICARLERLDRAAWESFYLENRRLVGATLASFLGYGTELDDLVQEVFVTAVSLVQSKKVRLRGDPAGLRAWLLAIADRLAHAEARRRKRARATRAEHDCESLAAPPADPALAETLQHTQQLLGELPYRLRIPWVLRNLERMTIPEAAATLGVSTATIKRRLTSADQRFRRLALRDPTLREYLEPRGSA
jgi:RNA polymerase sigma-70 factor (ECF subfamily)